MESEQKLDEAMYVFMVNRDLSATYENQVAIVHDKINYEANQHVSPYHIQRIHIWMKNPNELVNIDDFRSKLNRLPEYVKIDYPTDKWEDNSQLSLNNRMSIFIDFVRSHPARFNETLDLQAIISRSKRYIFIATSSDITQQQAFNSIGVIWNLPHLTDTERADEELHMRLLWLRDYMTRHFNMQTILNFFYILTKFALEFNTPIINRYRVGFDENWQRHRENVEEGMLSIISRRFYWASLLLYEIDASIHIYAKHMYSTFRNKGITSDEHGTPNQTKQDTTTSRWRMDKWLYLLTLPIDANIGFYDWMSHWMTEDDENKVHFRVTNQLLLNRIVRLTNQLALYLEQSIILVKHNFVPLELFEIPLEQLELIPSDVHTVLMKAQLSAISRKRGREDTSIAFSSSEKEIESEKHRKRSKIEEGPTIEEAE